MSFRLPAGLTSVDLPELGLDRRVAGNVIEVRTETPTADVATLAAWAVARGLELEALTLTRPSLEDVYLDLVGASAEPVPRDDLDVKVGTPVGSTS
jgi:ABC-2 type transport system ATP-binding protein